MEKTNRILYLDRLRVASIFLVMLLHVAAAFWDYVPIDGGKFVILSIYNGLAHICVPCLVMISGAVLLNQHKNETPGVILQKRVLPMAIILIFWTLAYGVIRTGIQAVAGYKGKDLWLYFVDCIFQPMHFWYLYMLLGLYLLLPILRMIVQNRERMCYFLLISFLASSLLPWLLENLGFEQQGGLRLEYLSFAIGYSGYCVMGYYLSEQATKLPFKRIIPGLFCFILVPLGTVWISRRWGINDGLFDYFSPLIWIGSSAVFLLFRYYANQPFKKKWHRILETRLNESSFGMYLVHMFFNEILIILGLTTERFPALIAAPILTTVVFSCSYFAVRILRKIPVFRNHLL